MHFINKSIFRKKISTRLSVAAVAVVSTMMFSCSKVNDQQPFAKIDPKDAFSNPDRIEKSAIGMYDALQNREYLGGRVLIYVDQRGNDANVASYFGNVPTFDMLSNNSFAFGCWSGAYRTIFESNFFTTNLKQNESVIGAAAAAHYYGEAKFIRALAYFYIINLYAQTYTFQADAKQPGVPLVLTAATNGSEAMDPKNKIKRNTVKEVYDQMIQDLNDAASLLPVSSGDAYADRARATKGAAHALLSRIYLFQGNYAKARDYADSVLLSSYNYTLDATPAAVFASSNYQASKERIFSVAMSQSDNPNTNNALGQHYGSSGRGDITINKTAYFRLPNFDPNTDLRAKPLYTFTTNAAKTDTTFYTKKFFGTSTVDAWVPVLRLAEVMLNKAEALAQLSPGIPDPQAILLLNKIRARAKAADLHPLTQAELLTNILTERRIELAFEGFGMFDYVRTHRTIPARGNVSAQDWNGKYTIFPIPFSETERNPNLQQNDGY